MSKPWITIDELAELMATFRGPLSAAEVNESMRRMDWFTVRAYLFKKERQISEILADPSDPRNEIVDDVRSRIERIRQMHASGLTVARAFADLQNVIYRYNVRRLSQPINAGIRVIEGGRTGANVAHGPADERAEKRATYVEAFQRIRPECKSDQEACNLAASELGVSPKTIRRALQK